VSINSVPVADIKNCQGFVLLSPSEYSAFVGYTQMPDSATLAHAFQAGFVLPMAGYLVSYLVGRLVAMFDHQ